MRIQIKSHLAPAATFLAGVIVSFTLNRVLDQKIDNGQKLITIVLAAVVLYVAILTWVLYSSHQEVKGAIERITSQFGLLAEFLETDSPEDEHLIFKRVNQLIAGAQTSLVFVELWAHSSGLVSENSKTQHFRKEYYDAITQKLREHRANKPKGTFQRPLLRRIVQIPSGDSVPIKLKSDGVLRKHLDDCFVIQRESPGLIALKVVKGYDTSSFAIIDHRIVIWPVYSFQAKSESPTRQGVIIFTDSTGDFVQRLTDIYEMLNNSATPLEGLVAKPGSN